MSKLETNTVDSISGTSTLTLGGSNASVVSAGTEVRSNKLSPASGTALQIGDSGDTITIPSGATIVNSGTQTGFGGTNTPAFQARLSGNYTLANNSQVVLPFADDSTSPKAFDTNGAFDTSTYKFTVPSGQAGKYYLYGCIRLDGAIASDRCALDIEVNNSSVGISGENQGAHAYFSVNAIGSVILSVGDYVTMKAFQDGGSSETVRSDATLFGGYKIIE